MAWCGQLIEAHMQVVPYHWQVTMRSSYAPQHFLLSHQAAGIAIRPLAPGSPADRQQPLRQDLAVRLVGPNRHQVGDRVIAMWACSRGGGPQPRPARSPVRRFCGWFRTTRRFAIRADLVIRRNDVHTLPADFNRALWAMTLVTVSTITVTAQALSSRN